MCSATHIENKVSCSGIVAATKVLCQCSNVWTDRFLCHSARCICLTGTFIVMNGLTIQLDCAPSQAINTKLLIVCVELFVFHISCSGDERRAGALCLSLSHTRTHIHTFFSRSRNAPNKCCPKICVPAQTLREHPHAFFGTTEFSAIEISLRKVENKSRRRRLCLVDSRYCLFFLQLPLLGLTSSGSFWRRKWNSRTGPVWLQRTCQQMWERQRISWIARIHGHRHTFTQTSIAAFKVPTIRIHS